MIRHWSRFLSLFCSFTVALLVAAGGGEAKSSCPGDDDNDKKVTIAELVAAVNASLDGCPSRPGCGDSIIQTENGEQCDGTELGGESCRSLGFGGGTLACNLTCQFDARGCACTVNPGRELLETGQRECDQGNGTLGACPGSPPGQDGAVRAGVPLRYTDNGDGTITDDATGLMWEKLSDDDSIHDFDNTYIWKTAFDKIDELNRAPGFANHRDWRLPNRRELESLVDVEYDPKAPPPLLAIHPVFETGCTPGCTVTECSCTLSLGHDYNWTSTTYQEVPTFAWAVNFNVGDVSYAEKAGVEFGVRAVRGGL